ncbi:MAG TPA: hypothetical protein VNV25_18815 [Gemmatimonadaceae bacterium]|nr:hypothetical protein [Gemmatimonadaceae bacterium]
MNPAITSLIGGRSGQRQLQALVVAAHRAEVAAVVRKIVPSKHWEEAEQLGALGVLVALEKYDPKTGSDRVGGFWNFARRHVRREIRKWLDDGERGTRTKKAA